MTAITENMLQFGDVTIAEGWGIPDERIRQLKSKLLSFYFTPDFQETLEECNLVSWIEQEHTRMDGTKMTSLAFKINIQKPTLCRPMYLGDE